MNFWVESGVVRAAHTWFGDASDSISKSCVAAAGSRGGVTYQPLADDGARWPDIVTCRARSAAHSSP
jgi:hypothetical protein